MQSAHAAIQFQHDYPSIATKWNSESKYLVMLSVQDKDSLLNFLEKIRAKNINVSVFVEPDIGNEITAIALEPTDKARRLCSNIPLMFKEYKNWKHGRF